LYYNIRVTFLWRVSRKMFLLYRTWNKPLSSCGGESLAVLLFTLLFVFDFLLLVWSVSVRWHHCPHSSCWKTRKNLGQSKNIRVLESSAARRYLLSSYSRAYCEATVIMYFWLKKIENLEFELRGGPDLVIDGAVPLGTFSRSPHLSYAGNIASHHYPWGGSKTVMTEFDHSLDLLHYVSRSEKQASTIRQKSKVMRLQCIRSQYHDSTNEYHRTDRAREIYTNGYSLPSRLVLFSRETWKKKKKKKKKRKIKN
jgi:hypothetical protein